VNVVRRIADNEHGSIANRPLTSREVERACRDDGTVAGILGERAVGEVLEQAVVSQLRARTAARVPGQEIGPSLTFGSTYPCFSGSASGSNSS
jgi:hypothetical protein